MNENFDKGFDVIVGVDNDQAALNTFEKNHNGAVAMNADLSKQETFDEIKRIAKGCEGVKRTTGQHAGGIIVIPDYMDVYDFTPYQFPADDKTAEWRTTHFDYHAIDECVLKLDILGHDDPTMIIMLEDLTGINAVEIPFDSNQDSIAFINKQNYLYEITDYFAEQFEEVMNAIGNSSRDSVLDDILYYIEHNYHTNIKLESIAALFGYNSSYLGKIFNKSVGESFNSYVDQVRIKHAIELLVENKHKVYEIAELVGYKNVDYFHKKFKKYVGESPAEYRKKLDGQDA